MKNEKDIRNAIYSKLIKAKVECDETLVIDELGLSHGQNRVDIAVVNGAIHGYEIKSQRDNLSRLPSQISAYEKSLQKLTIVAAPNHLEGVLELAPSWSGIFSLSIGSRGAIHFKCIRRPKTNPSVDFVSVAHLLWRDEAASLLERKGFPCKTLRLPRNKLYKELSQVLTIEELVHEIKLAFKSRKNWRVGE